ncbi:MAG: hypothetical protein JKY20_01335 [Alphaproteobacteria bacterium]|nr:hypothetical protein [Alphaproteobacteria bacterium]
METFTGDWLSLRIPVDRAARSRELAVRFVEALPENPRIVDLAAGAGANARYFESETKWGRADSSPRWTLVDGDAALLQRAAGLVGALNPVVAELGAGAAGFAPSEIDGLTASAFFDLVSDAWFENFVKSMAGAPLFLALSVDGRWRWGPTHDDDVDIMACFARDQQRDKGFGPAMGGDSATAMARILTTAGYTVSTRRSDWRLDGTHTALLKALIQTIAGAVTPYDVDAAKWRKSREYDIEQGRLRLCLGHMDILAM